MPRVSLVATVLNERASIDAWLAGIWQQTHLPDEVVVVDGGSTDGTCELLVDAARAAPVPMRVLRAPGATIAAGRNRAIEEARGEIVAVTDAGTVAHPTWLEELVAIFDHEAVDVAGGFFVPSLTSRWERALAAATLPDVNEVQPDRFQPSSRSVAFRRTWWQRGVRYPEWLDYCEDLVWDLALRRAGARVHFVPDAVVTFHVRPDPGSFWRQYYRYARGDGKAGLFPLRHALRYVTYGGLLAVLARRRGREFGVAAVLGAVYVRRPFVRLWRRDRQARLPVRETLCTAPLVVLLRGWGDLAKMAGYPVGLRWRWRRLGTLGWRTSWQRVNPCGELWRPGASTRGSHTPTSSPGA